MVMRTLEGGCSVPIGIETEWVSKRSTEGSGIGVKPAEDYHNLTGVATSGPENSEQPLEGEEALTDEMIMRAIVVSLDGQEAAEVETKRHVGSREDAEQFGWDVARMLVDKGADKILESITLNRDIIHEQGEA
jgi:hydroxymethylbilane synthase